MSEPLWNDERIQQEASSAFWNGNKPANARMGGFLLRKMRLEYEQRIAELETENTRLRRETQHE